MIKRFKSPLRRIVGRLKEYMLIAALAFSFVLIPLGYYFMIEGESYIIGVIGEATVIIGFILFVVVLFKIIREENRKNKEDKQRFDSLMTEIRGLRQDLGAKGAKENEQ